jgi:hypothetical protein
VFTDDDRRTLLEALETSIGDRPAAILMGHLPPVGWADLATKGDIAELRGEMHALLPRLITANIASMIAIAGLVLAAVAIGR